MRRRRCRGRSLRGRKGRSSCLGLVLRCLLLRGHQPRLGQEAEEGGIVVDLIIVIVVLFLRSFLLLLSLSLFLAASVRGEEDGPLPPHQGQEEGGEEKGGQETKGSRGRGGGSQR
jgi:hypothetical protein